MTNSSLTAHQEDGPPYPLRLRPGAPFGGGGRAARPGGWLAGGHDGALPGAVVTNDGIEDGEQLASNRNEGKHFRLAGRDQPVEERLEHGVVLLGHHGAHEQSGAHVGSATADEASPLPLARLTRVRAQTGK